MPHFSCPMEALHRAWDNSLAPAITVDPGDTVTFTTADVSDGKVPGPEWAVPGPPTFALGIQPLIRRGHTLSGPVAIRGAEAGDVLAVEVVDVKPAEWGWTGIGNNGILGGEVADRKRILWDLRGTHALPIPSMNCPVQVPIRPFCGVMGVVPADPGEHSTTPPRAVGGNLDIRHLTAGSTLLLPVAVSGALFSCGDVHASQGDGEVCGTGIECAATVTVRFQLRRDMSLTGPAFVTSPPPVIGNCYGATGIGPDLLGAGRQALRRMIAFLQSDYQLSFDDAYILCSVAADLSISEAVNPPNWVVTALLPLNILG